MASSRSAQRPGIPQLVGYILYKFDSLRLVAPTDDPQYHVWFAERARNLAAYNQLSKLLGPSIFLCTFLCLARLAFVRWSLPLARRAPGIRFRRLQDANEAARGSGADSAPESPSAREQATGPGGDLRWVEGCWTMAGSTGLLMWSWLCVWTSNGGCPSWPSLDTGRCLAGWPLLPMPPLVRDYYCCELAWYLHLLVKHQLGVGLRDNRVMVAHHLTTVYLIVMSYCFSLHQPGVLMLALLNSSTPLLHLSKMAHHTGNRNLALASFAAFAVVFGASRVVVFPLVFLPLGLLYSRRHIPNVLRHYTLMFAMVNGLLLALVAMQWAWFAAIVRILRQAAVGDVARLNTAARSVERRRQKIVVAATQDEEDDKEDGDGGPSDGADAAGEGSDLAARGATASTGDGFRRDAATASDGPKARSSLVKPPAARHWTASTVAASAPVRKVPELDRGSGGGGSGGGYGGGQPPNAQWAGVPCERSRLALAGCRRPVSPSAGNACGQVGLAAAAGGLAWGWESGSGVSCGSTGARGAVTGGSGEDVNSGGPWRGQRADVRVAVASGGSGRRHDTDIFRQAVTAVNGSAVMQPPWQPATPGGNADEGGTISQGASVSGSKGLWGSPAGDSAWSASCSTRGGGSSSGSSSSSNGDDYGTGRDSGDDDRDLDGVHVCSGTGGPLGGNGGGGAERCGVGDSGGVGGDGGGSGARGGSGYEGS